MPNEHSCKVIGCFGYLPSKIVSNFDLARAVDTSDEWITSRTGIRSRRIADESEKTSDLAFKAAKGAMLEAGLTSVDFIILATTTPDNTFPSSSARLQASLSEKFIPAVDIQAVCSGFLYAIELASSLISGGRYKTILVVCADKMSSIVDWSDRGTCVLFGDGAGAVVLSKSNSGFLDVALGSDGNFYDSLCTSGGASSSELVGKVQMDGQVVFKHAVQRMSEVSSLVLERNKLSITDVDHFVPHQANSRIMSAVAKELKIPQEKVVSTVSEHANCGAASIPLALWDMKCKSKINDGDLILMCAFGAGFTWGASLLRW